MEHADFTRSLREQYDALRALIAATDLTSPVPTCPGWTVEALARHVARTHAWSIRAALTPPDTTSPPRPEEGPEDWSELLDWWDERFTELLRVLTTEDPSRPSWTFIGPGAVSFWARRQTHETAVHRLDAEHASHAALGTDVPVLLFPPDLAADGVDEYLTTMLTRQHLTKPNELSGRAVLHAADASRSWLLRLTPGEAPEVGPLEGSAVDEDVTAAGTADSLYRLVWARPSHAVVTGRGDLLRALPRP
ncbi:MULTISPECIES: maleylpyruvate isomerase N-terminal domain-containing protein [Actinosynnema]|uniref:maleylpyruvate isomerase N-terminal domain-containing protein n=1 Tax=Actinosynnema TaxID=40566 RepID=UPI0020A30BF1|nr:maleylpyruvate isomerase N-terminal domain-containing protein [Actinosynnema pretiosum]MCP2093839.1 TIGR03083 family protein [Actinosynnema pretiosum]